ncbi:hypothetical protein IKF92_02640 [Candidatus Saccharibacteria bacterium]|nr:hypothetical protein [Candidatus Saccharibacteria bacterium]
MGIIVNKENSQDELSRRISADLKDRAEETERMDDPDLAEDAEYLRDLKKPGRFGWMWFVLIALATLSVISIIFF